MFQHFLFLCTNLSRLCLALPFIANFAAGAIAGISEILTFYPLGAYYCSLQPVRLA